MASESPLPLSTEAPFVGLAPFLRMSVAGEALMPIGQSLLAEAQQYLEDANLWMNLSVVMQILGQREIGVQIQSQALELKRVYTLAAAQQPAV